MTTRPGSALQTRECTPGVYVYPQVSTFSVCVYRNAFDCLVHVAKTMTEAVELAQQYAKQTGLPWMKNN